MRKINLKGVTSEAVAGVIILLVALVNAIFQMFGINTLPIEDHEVTTIISTVFLIITTLWNTWKNRNLTTASQAVQTVTDAIKNGEILAEDLQEIMEKVKNERKG